MQLFAFSAGLVRGVENDTQKFQYGVPWEVIFITNELTKRQKRFLCRFARCGNISEAAVYCGISPDSAYEEGMKILRHPKAFEFFPEAAATVRRYENDSVERCLDRLINGRVNDAVILAKSDPAELTEEDVRKLDLYNVSEMKFGKGVCEIKFADRIKAIEKLSEIRCGRASDNTAQSFFDATGRAADDTDGGTE